MNDIERNSYLEFLKRLKILESKSSIRNLDPIETLLLNHLMQKDFEKTIVFVGDLLKLDHVGSQATIHGRIKSLIKIGYIVLITQENDARQKRVMPTPLAYSRLKSLSRCLLG